MIAVQLALPEPIGWTPPEPRLQREHQQRLVLADDPQITFPEWLFAFRTNDVAQWCGIPTAILLAKARWGFNQAEDRVLTALLIEIYQFMEDNGAAKRIAWGRLCWLSGLDRRTMRRGLKSLEELRVISIKRRGTRRVNVYGVNPPEEWLAKPSSSRRSAAPSLAARVVRVK